VGLPLIWECSGGPPDQLGAAPTLPQQAFSGLRYLQRGSLSQSRQSVALAGRARVCDGKPWARRRGYEAERGARASTSSINTFLPSAVAAKKKLTRVPSAPRRACG